MHAAGGAEAPGIQARRHGTALQARHPAAWLRSVVVHEDEPRTAALLEGLSHGEEYPELNRVSSLLDTKCGIVASMSDFGRRLKHARELKQMSVRLLGKRAGISRTAVSNLETGVTSTVRLENAVALALALKVPPEWLCFGIGAIVP